MDIHPKMSVSLFLHCGHVLSALEAIVAQHDEFRNRCGNQEDAYNLIASRYDLFEDARTAIFRARGEA